MVRAKAFFPAQPDEVEDEVESKLDNSGDSGNEKPVWRRGITLAYVWCELAYARMREEYFHQLHQWTDEE
jgi:hypothetical protein